MDKQIKNYQERIAKMKKSVEMRHLEHLYGGVDFEEVFGSQEDAEASSKDPKVLAEVRKFMQPKGDFVPSPIDIYQQRKRLTSWQQANNINDMTDERLQKEGFLGFLTTELTWYNLVSRAADQQTIGIIESDFGLEHERIGVHGNIRISTTDPKKYPGAENFNVWELGQKDCGYAFDLFFERYQQDLTLAKELYGKAQTFPPPEF